VGHGFIDCSVNTLLVSCFHDTVLQGLLIGEPDSSPQLSGWIIPKILTEESPRRLRNVTIQEEQLESWLVERHDGQPVECSPLSR
jgi:hypothetical protein